MYNTIFYKNRPKEDQEVISYICNKILFKKSKEDYFEVPYDNEFTFVYIDGRKDLNLDTLEHHAMFTSCRIFTEKKYPICCFINNIIGNENCLTAGKYGATLYKIDEINSHDKYSEFCINKLPFLFPLNIENLIFIAPDGFLMKSGIEDFLRNINCDYIGSPWLHSPSIQIMNGNGMWFDFTHPIRVGNGGFSFRKLSKMKECFKYSSLPLREKGTINKFPTEDLFYGSFINENGKLASIEQAKQFSTDPLDLNDFKNKVSFGFHFPVAVNQWK